MVEAAHSVRIRASRPGPALLLVWLAIACACSPQVERAGDEALPAAEYVGADACRSCHLGIASTYAQTGMGRAFHAMDSTIVEADFVDRNTFYSDRGGIRYEMFERDGRYFQKQYVFDDMGRERAVQEHELVYAVGSNTHNRAYLIQIGDRLFQAPVCWYPQAQRWDLCPGYEHENSHFSRETDETCVFCHNGVMRRVEGTRNAFHQPIPEGIGCERCHGPGSAHVERWSDGDADARGEADATIVNPRRLDHDERMSVCTQCHLADAAATERVAVHGRDTYDFRPGEPLTASIEPFRYAAPTRHDFSLSSQADRLMRSACYLESDQRLDCLTCHNPHVSTYSPEQPVDHFIQKCRGCHEQDDCSAPDAQRASTPFPDDCVACHMRTAEPDDQRFTVFTDHWIRKRIDDDARDFRQQPTIEPIYPNSLEARAYGEAAYYRARASFLLAGEARRAWRNEMYRDAVVDFRAAVDAGFDNAASRFFLAKSLLFLSRLDEAIPELEAALAHDPDHHDAAFALGQAWTGLQQVDRAIEVYQGLIDREPDHTLALAEFGRLAWMRGRYADALAAYKRAVGLEPWNAIYQLNLGRVLAMLGRFEEAALVGERATALAPDDPDAWEFFAAVMREAGRPADAAFGSRRVAELRASR